MSACADWIAAAYLRDHGESFPDPPCAHPADRCPPLTRKETR